MFGKKKPDRSKPTRRADRSGNLSQFGLFDVPTNLSVVGNMDEDMHFNETDSDLEAELLALSGDSGSSSYVKRSKDVTNIDTTESESKDNSADDESVDENDPELLSELNEITGVSKKVQSIPTPSESVSVTTDTQKLLEARLEMYKVAEQNAKTAGETSRARRFNRGIKQLQDLIKQAKQGKTIPEEDIPPEVSTKPHTHTDDDNSQLQPNRTAPPPPTSTGTPVPDDEPSSPVYVPVESDSTSVLKPENEELLKMLNTRKTEYKMAALKAKKSGDNQNAISYIKVAKQFEVVIKAVEEGQEVDLSEMPGPPAPAETILEKNKTQTGSDSLGEINVPDDIPEPTLLSASSLLEDLQQRLEVYQKQEEKAKEEGNSSKVRRMGRIVKQFEDAIKLHKNGKPIPLDELPTPPGYAPLKTDDGDSPKSSEAAAAPSPSKPALPAKPKGEESGSKPKPMPAARISGNRKTTTQADKQLAELLERQKQFKLAALKAKQKGEIAEAKEFLRTAKGFDPLIEAAEGGLPVDFASLPLPPTEKAHLEDEVEVVMAEECTEDDQGTLDVLKRLEQQLVKQIKMCIETRDHNKAIGDVAGANRFENLALSVSKDLDTLRLARKTALNEKSQVPKFHYETKHFSIVKTFTELNDNDLELTIVRGVNYNCSNPNEIDTYVRFEFPWPQEEPVKNKTSVVRNTNNPEYNMMFWLPIQRKARACQRVFKRHGIKFEVYSKGGLFRGDTLLGSVTVKLQPLETQCEIHDSFDLLEGRKKVGGKLEIRIRIRDPILTREVEQTSERWLIIDSLT
ncbi:coiled-coil and C2 domain-containing protein 1-like isoform X2 [Agrilus planipennis]|uniref:Coiled-coil and C2 domain-containing protein 1-like isoform X2 n=1 Tax=Agrilus planipennis TaxID=224129 RepID=A0A1W4XKT8_AGRPL|nr:coiled-coil and C2 domain-containing protein 1-like isoform X2 [Agrilus planipennis]